MNLPGFVVHLLLLMTVFFWGMSFVFIRQALTELLPVELTLLRFILASAGFLCFLAVSSRSRVKIDRRDYWRFIVLGLLGVGGYHLALNFGELWISAGTASLIVATNPLLIALFSALILKEKLGANKVIGLLVAFSGLLLVLARDGGHAAQAAHPVLGAILVFGAALSWTFYSILAKPLFARYPSATVTAYVTIIGTVLLLPLLRGGLFAKALTVSGSTWVGLLFISILSTFIGYICWYYALSRRDASQVAVYIYLNPVFASAGAAVLLHEGITPLFLFGGLLVISGVALANLKVSKKAESKKLVTGAGNANTDSEVFR